MTLLYGTIYIRKRINGYHIRSQMSKDYCNNISERTVIEFFDKTNSSEYICSNISVTEL
jgi:hypothetical protein